MAARVRRLGTGASNSTFVAFGVLSARMSGVQASNRAVTSAVLATLVAVAGVLGNISIAGHDGLILAALLVALGVVFALGWPRITGLPAGVQSTVVVSLAGAGAVVAVWLSTELALLNTVPLVFAGAVLAAFIAELTRRDGRENLVASVSGTVSGALVPVTAVGWLAAERTVAGDAVVVTGAVALAVGSVVSALPLRSWLRATVIVAVCGVTGVAVVVPLPEVGYTAGVLLGLSVGVLVAVWTELFDRLPTRDGRWEGGAVAVLPVAITGLLVYLVGRVLIG